MKKRWVLLCLLLLLFCKMQTVYAGEVLEKTELEESALFAQGAVLMDAVSGRVLYGKNPDLPLAMASTTKIMTCIVALELGGLEETVTASAYAAGQPKVKLYLQRGEQVLFRDLLYSLMLESHNDAAAAIAEHIGAKMLGMENDSESVAKRTQEESKKAVKEFVAYMNRKARELQCYHTWFITPNGLDATETFYEDGVKKEERAHSTTAQELARMMSYCILQSPKKEEFLQITGTYSYDFMNVEKTRSFVCRNHNAFLNMMRGVISGKTGYTGQAGYCYVGALQRDGRCFVVALLNTGAYGGANKNRKWKDATRLMEYGIANFRQKEVYDGKTVTKAVAVENAVPQNGAYFDKVSVKTVVQDTEAFSFLVADWEKTEVVLSQKEKITAPVRKGQVVGSVKVLLNDRVIRCFDVVCAEAVSEKTVWDAVQYVACRYLCKKTGKDC